MSIPIKKPRIIITIGWIKKMIRLNNRQADSLYKSAAECNDVANVPDSSPTFTNATTSDENRSIPAIA